MSKQNNSNKLDAENVTYENLVKSFEDKFHLPIYRANSYPFVPSNMVGKYLIAEEWERVFKESDRNRHHEALNSICRMAIGRELTEQDKSYSVIAEIFKKVGGAVNTEELWKEAHSLLDKISKLIEFEDSDRQKDNISKWIFGLKNIIDLSHSIFEKSNSSNGIQSISPENAVDSDPVFKIFYGPPGTGKTMAARKKVGNSIEKYKIVQVHPSSSYEDMIEGIKPVTFANGDVKYEVQDGPIKIMSKKASNSWVKSIACARFFQDEGDEFILINFPIGTVSKWFSMGEKYCCRIYGESVYKPIITNETVKSDTFKIDIKNSEDKTFWRKLGFSLNQKSKIEERFLQLEFKGNNWGADDYVIVLDELNRGNVASILGELVFAISEARGTHSASERKAVTLQYSHEEFVWPRNLHLYGTMNSTDVSLDRIYQAIKRRFDF